MESDLRRLMTVDTSPDGPLMRENGPLAFVAEWATAFSTTGETLGNFARDGKLGRGVRAVLAHHVIFHWNRIGLRYQTQCLLANVAKAVVFGG